MKHKSFLKAAVAATLLVAVVSSGLAFGAHPFMDVPDGRFYTEAVDWAFNNGITTGKTATTFAPDDTVTRGENITFAKRYDDFVVQPALDDRYTKAEVDAAIAAAVPKIYHAVVNGDGTTRPGTTSGVLVTKPGLGTGGFEVEFPPDDIHECVYQATLVNELTTIGGGAFQPVLGPVRPDGQVTVAEDWDDNPFDPDESDVRDADSLEVQTDDSTGTPSDKPFHLTVFC